MRILIVSERTVVRAGYRMLFETQSDLEVVGDAGDMCQIARSLQGKPPDVVIIDSAASTLDAADVVRCFARNASNVRCLALVAALDERVPHLLHAGVRGLLLNHSSSTEIISAVRLVAAGYTLFFSAGGSFAAGAKSAVATESEVRREPDPETLERLTRREVDVLRLIARGCSNAEIAAVLYVSESTVKSHVQRMLDKLDLRNRVHAVIYAYERGMMGTEKVSVSA
ncbi:response regulator transcription factor [Streptomyces sp. AJS327]|uniref:response regulator transcription factor n=1 Tax=Streptomyces sp. AJS327 TaxID=2545265 RepID=UPI0015DF0D2F|nr:response regulator transcription factor [Streptomyces sp. AJS327]MBA0053731.1 response regulator transcription factor [Streptomyces sp. AJS327]